ncbi:MAG: hypothetical protein KFW21_04265 [Spirochaetota bacterium]|nr:hypothetical protein [Spirochaetota bacterium]
MKKLLLVFLLIFTFNSCSTKDENFNSNGLGIRAFDGKYQSGSFSKNTWEMISIRNGKFTTSKASTINYEYISGTANSAIFSIMTTTGITYGKFRLLDGRLLKNSPDTDNGSIDIVSNYPDSSLNTEVASIFNVKSLDGSYLKNGIHPNDNNKIVINNGSFSEGSTQYKLVAFSTTDGVGVFQVGSQYTKVQLQSANPYPYLKRGSNLHNSIELAGVDLNFTLPELVSITIWDASDDTGKGNKYIIKNGMIRINFDLGQEYTMFFIKDLGKKAIMQKRILIELAPVILSHTMRNEDRGELQ